MRPTRCNLNWFAAAVCVLAGSGFAVAQQGVVRISDGGQTPPATNAAYGQVKLNMYQASYHTATVMPDDAGSYTPPISFEQSDATQQACPEQSYPQGCGVGVCATGSCGTEGCCTGGCGEGCSSWGDCNSGRCGCDICLCDPCNCNGGACYGDGYNQRMCTLFARPAKDCGTTCLAKRAWRGQQYNYLARNKRLANCLFGWLVPSGSCGKGTPPVGKYSLTYADQPDYADSRDGQLYGAQGYGMPMTVPVAPTVRYAYNYSWGTPASRLTPLSTYNPQTSPQPLLHQTW